MLSGATGRALLFDLDKKFDEQDRLIKYLMKQQNTFEDQLVNMRQSNNKVSDAEHATIGKIEQQVRY